MLPELGHFALILAWLLALALAAQALTGARDDDAARLALARRLAGGVALFATLAFAALAAAFVANDFSVRNVAENSSTLLPAAYRFTAAWGSHEGSMLLWAALQALWLLAVARLERGAPPLLHARVLGVMALVAAGFMAFVLFASNPFVRVFPVPAQGRDLNPLLQDPGMVAHPPLLYMGYVGLSASFAFALAALLGGHDAGDWARHARRWAAAAWGFLTLGVAVGSGWAYYELGWGGWWFWDPVENAALMPWITATALLHALAVADRRGALRAWAVLLAIGAFSLALLGTFVVRSGVLASVHAFALDPRRGLFVLGLLAAVAGGSLALFARRAVRLGPGAPAAALSRDALLLAGTLLLAVITGTVLLGTFYPLVHEALGLGRLSVGAPYFEAVFVPLVLPLLALMGLAPLAHWARDALPALARRASAPLAGALLAGAAAALKGSWLLALGLALACWVALATLREVASRRQALARQPLAWWGMVAAHLGVAVCVTGAAVVRSLGTETERRMAPGERIAVGGHELRFEGVAAAQGANYDAERGEFVLLRGGREVGRLHPEKRRYQSLPATPMTEAAIASSWRGDVYVSLGEALGGGAWTVRAQHKPLVTWIWGGAALMALGALLAALDRRRRARATPHAGVAR